MMSAGAPSAETAARVTPGLQSRSKAVWEQLVATQHRRVFNLLLRLTSDREVAADLTQEAFVAAYSSADRFAGRSEPGTWLCGIALNCHRSWRRRQGKLEPMEELPDDLPDPAPSADELALLAARDGLLRSAVDSLPEPYRRTVALHYFAEIPSVEIATEEGVDPGTVRWRLHKALKQLWVILEPELRKEEP